MTGDSEQLLRAVLGSLPVMLLAYDRDLACTLAEGRGLELLGRPPEALVGMPIADLAAPHADLQDKARRALDGAAGNCTVPVRGAVLDVYCTPLRDDAGDVVGGLLVGVDATARHRAESALRETLQRLGKADAERQRLLGYLVGAQEEERTRIAADVHDDSLQALAAVKMRLEMLVDSLDEAQRAKLHRVERDLDAAAVRLRTLLFRLRPSALDHGTLGGAVEELLAQSSDGRISARVHDRLQSAPPAATRVVVYRIVQEAVANVHKHAHASNLDVHLDDHDGGVLVTVRDDGVGFDYEQARRAQLPGHLGLSTMRERADVVGGRLSVESAPGRGTVVGFWIPCGDADVASSPPPPAPDV